MRKVIIALLAAALLLTGCGKRSSHSTPILPKVTYAEVPAVTAPPTPAPPEWPALFDDDIPSKISELYIMDEGFKANAVAGLDDTLLAADLDEPEYQLVLAHYRLTDAGMVEVTDRMVLLQGPNEEDTYQAEIRGISAGPDGCYYVLTAEAPRKALHIDLAAGSYEIAENPDYSGKFKVLKYSTDGVLLDAVDYNNLPIDATGAFTACASGKLLVFAFDSISEDQQKNEFDFTTINSTSLIVLDFNTGKYDAYKYGMDLVGAACPYGENAMVFMERISENPDAGLFLLNLNTGEFGKISWPYTFGEYDSGHTPFCFTSGSDVIVNNQRYYGIFNPETCEYDPLLNSIPEYQSEPDPEFPDLLDYPMFSTCCRVGEKTFVGAVAMNSAPLYVVCPA
ncbi:MAG: hypothetical protein MJ135_05130 [Oscillospiraceae bacterium]|nr:hypothetical protein [Oscillospiraceae bacterium]